MQVSESPECRYQLADIPTLAELVFIDLPLNPLYLNVVNDVGVKESMGRLIKSNRFINRK